MNPLRHAKNLMRGQRAVIIALSLFALVYGFSATRRQLATGNDFPVYLDAARTLLEGRSPYQFTEGLNGYVYLPFFALVLSPMVVLPVKAAVWLWYAVNVTLTVLSFLLTRTLVRALIGDRHAAWATVVSLVVHSRFFLGNYDVGQINILILDFSLWSVKLAAVDGRSFRGGWPLGVAAVIKPHVLVLLAPFLLRGRWKMSASVCLAIAVAGFVVPSIVIGAGATRRLTAEWYRLVVVPARAGTLQGSAAHDQSPEAALRRLVVNEPAFDDVRVNWWSLSNHAYVRLVRMLRAVLGLTLFAAWIKRPKNDQTGLLIDVALAFIGMLVLFGYLTRPHFVLLLLPGAILALLWRDRSPLLPTRRISSVLLAIAAALIFLTTPFIIGRTAQQWTLAYSVVTVATLVQMALLVIVRFRLPSEGVGGLEASNVRCKNNVAASKRVDADG